ncbi:hypothetical protein pb186bvf_018511 [Paramecium bursaria]
MEIIKICEEIENTLVLFMKSKQINRKLFRINNSFEQTTQDEILIQIKSSFFPTTSKVSMFIRVFFRELYKLNQLKSIQMGQMTE